MSSETNIWDFLTDLIPVFATLFGVITSHFLKNYGEVKTELNDLKLKFDKVGQDDWGNEIIEKAEIEFLEGGKCEALIDFQNTSGNFKNIKDVNLIVKTMDIDHHFSLNFLYIDGVEAVRDDYNKIVNLIRFSPKEIKRVKLKGQFKLNEKEDINHYGLSVYLTFTDNKNNNIKNKLKYINPEDIYRQG